LNKIGLSILTVSVALVASTLCLQAAITQQTTTENKGLKWAKQRLVDLSSEIDSARRKLRLLTLEPGGTIELHSHKDHPTILHVIKGTLTSRTQGKPEVVLCALASVLPKTKTAIIWFKTTAVNQRNSFGWVFETMP
jgi:hypothetical protein